MKVPLTHNCIHSMLIYPKVDPVAFVIGPIQVHWYGITYLAAFVCFLLLALRRVRLEVFSSRRWNSKEVEDLLFFGVIGVVVGGRLGYVLFYKLGYYLSNPLEMIAVWKGGMSFHGGMLGVLIAMALFASRRNRAFYEVCDLIAPCVPTGLAMGRLGNFINGELWGRLANPNLPWSMVFPDSGTLAPRHPSQIYELLLEGILLFVILWLYARRKNAYTGVRGQAVWGKVSGVFLVLYGVFRFISEYFREPDAFLGLLQLGLSMGQWLSLPMVLMGGIIFWVASHSGNVGKVPSS